RLSFFSLWRWGSGRGDWYRKAIGWRGGRWGGRRRGGWAHAKLGLFRSVRFGALGHGARGLRYLLASANLRQVIGGGGERCGCIALFIQQRTNLLDIEVLDACLDLAQRQVHLLKTPDQLQAQQMLFAIQCVLPARIGPR